MRQERFSCKTNFIKLEIEGDETPLHASSDTHKTVSILIETGGWNRDVQTDDPPLSCLDNINKTYRPSPIDNDSTFKPTRILYLS